MKVLSEYPRPQMVRDSYYNLNGEWNCGIYDKKKNTKYKGKIVVPYSPETELSKVMQTVKPGDTLVYEKKIKIDPDTNKGRIWLNFGAVDQLCNLYVNGKLVGKHVGGFDPFSFDITDYVDENNEAKISLEVKDYTEKSELSRGKQASHPWLFTYKAQSGIWQSVWMESTPKKYIKNVRLKPDVDHQSVIVKVLSNVNEECDVNIVGKVHHIKTNKACRIKIDNPIYWSPDNPHLYDVDVSLGEDKVKTYFGYRKIEVKKIDGISRVCLNGEPIFLRGVLDQGYYKDGLYTPESNDQFAKDIQTIKKLGFNTIRKHVKIESARFYHECDKAGMLVVQDIPNGGGFFNWLAIGLPMLFKKLHYKDNSNSILHRIIFSRWSKLAMKSFKREALRAMSTLYNFPCIIAYTIFNESWGQFDSRDIYELLKKYDNSRLYDVTSGWHDQKCGDLKSIHHYYGEYEFEEDELGRPIFLSEIGGAAFGKDKAQYKNFKNEDEFIEYIKTILDRDVNPNIAKGLVGYVYTQYMNTLQEANGLVDEDGNIKSNKLINLFKDNYEQRNIIPRKSFREKIIKVIEARLPKKVSNGLTKLLKKTE